METGQLPLNKTFLYNEEGVSPAYGRGWLNSYQTWRHFFYSQTTREYIEKDEILWYYHTIGAAGEYRTGSLLREHENEEQEEKYER